MPSASLLQFQLGGSDFPAAVRAVAEGTVDGVEARLIGRQELDDAAGAAEQRATSPQQCFNAQCGAVRDARLAARFGGRWRECGRRSWVSGGMEAGVIAGVALGRRGATLFGALQQSAGLAAAPSSKSS